ncbi:MAG: winged helix family two component transcriptional regulator [Actinomycetia bacterium]|nr:winged helix family two component transcriptional regulator [Actinomycetes bacterium]
MEDEPDVSLRSVSMLAAARDGLTEGEDRPAGRPRVLVVEDDAALRRALVATLDASGFEVLGLADGLALAEEVDRFRPDLAVLDVGFSVGPDGFAQAQDLRSQHGVPVIFVTAADALEDRLRGFEVGGDDYLVKPFAMAELLARARVVLRRTGRLTSPTIEVRDLLLDEANRVVRRGGQVVELTKTEFEVLCALAREPGRVLSKVQLLALVWGFDEFAPNLVEVHVSSLRRKLEAHGPRLIHTERGEGYVLRP